MSEIAKSSSHRERRGGLLVRGGRIGPNPVPQAPLAHSYAVSQMVKGLTR